MMQRAMQGNISLHILAMLSLVTGVGSIAFGFYLVPYLYFDWVYEVPQFIVDVGHLFETEHNLLGWSKAAAITAPFMLAGGLLVFIAAWLTAKVEPEVGISLPESEEIVEENEEASESVAKYTLQGLVFIALVLAGLFLIEFIVVSDFAEFGQ